SAGHVDGRCRVFRLSATRAGERSADGTAARADVRAVRTRSARAGRPTSAARRERTAYGACASRTAAGPAAGWAVHRTPGTRWEEGRLPVWPAGAVLARHLDRQIQCTMDHLGHDGHRCGTCRALKILRNLVSFEIKSDDALHFHHVELLD